MLYSILSCRVHWYLLWSVTATLSLTFLQSVGAWCADWSKVIVWRFQLSDGSLCLVDITLTVLLFLLYVLPKVQQQTEQDAVIVCPLGWWLIVASSIHQSGGWHQNMFCTYDQGQESDIIIISKIPNTKDQPNNKTYVWTEQHIYNLSVICSRTGASCGVSLQCTEIKEQWNKHL